MGQCPQIGGGGGDWAVVDKKRLTELPWGKAPKDPLARSYLVEFISVWWPRNWSQTDSHKGIILNLHIRLINVCTHYTHKMGEHRDSYINL